MLNEVRVSPARHRLKWLASVWVGTASSIGVVLLALAGSAFGATITSFTPTDGLAALEPGCEGTPVVISGTGFGSPASGATVLFNGVPATVVQVGSDSTIYADVPSGATSGPITVQTSAGAATSSSSFAVDNCPYTNSVPLYTTSTTTFASITSVAPSSGKVGAKLTINGKGFAHVAKVTIGGKKAAFKVVSPSTITATVPTTAKPGTAKVTVITPAGTAKSTTSFTVK